MVWILAFARMTFSDNLYSHAPGVSLRGGKAPSNLLPPSLREGGRGMG